MDKSSIAEKFGGVQFGQALEKQGVLPNVKQAPQDRDERLADAITLLANTLGKKESDEKAVGAVHSAVRLHDGNGIFGGMGLDRNVITAHVRPTGIANFLPLLPSVDADPRFASVTGFSDEIGARATEACADAPTGYMKGCNLTALFGLERQDTNTIEMDKVMLRWNRGDYTDLILRGRVLGLSGVTPGNLNQDGILNIITKTEMISAAIRAERQLVRQMWQGNILLAEFPGLDSQINTGQVDADTNTACPALDSDVKDFAYNNVCGTGNDIVEYLSMLVYYLTENSRTMGLDPTSWAVVMRPQLWQELSACWPCRYFSNRCQDAAGTTIAVMNDATNIDSRDGMRRALTIPINGVHYPVILDDGIFEHNSTNNANVPAGSWASSIYFVPLTIQGGFPVLYREYLDYRHSFVGANTKLADNRTDFWTDDGVYSWAIDNNKWCYQLALKTEQRIILRAPQLSGKIQHVLYDPLQHTRSAFPTSPYWQDGGVSIRTDSTKYSVWAASGVDRGG